MSRVYKKSLLAAMVAAALPVMVTAATTDNTIYVTTTADENDQVSNDKCSLREAIIAAKTNKAYGGCIAGQFAGSDKIKFKNPGTYVINSPLVIDSPLNITGADAFNFDQLDTVTGGNTARSQLNTIIKANGAFSLFNNGINESAITLNSLVLMGGNGVKGGAIRSSGVVTLNRVYIMNSQASQEGGAIYLDGSKASLSATDSIFYANQAVRGAVLSMSCLDSLRATPRSISFERTSILSNGSASTQSVLHLCGNFSATISTSTISGNTVGGAKADGVILYRHNPDAESPLHTDSVLTLQSNTIVQNNGWSTLVYDNVGTLNLAYNVLAYNKGGKSCRYYPYGVANAENAELKDEKAKVKSNFDAIFKDRGVNSPNPEGECYLPVLKEGTTDQRNIYDLNSVRNNFDQLFYPLPPFNETSLSLKPTDLDYRKLEGYGFLPAYIPKRANAASGTVGGKSASVVDLEGSGCSAIDQRSSPRNIRLFTAGNPKLNLCDRGSIELNKLYSDSVVSISNYSVIERIDSIKSDIKKYQDIMNAADFDVKFKKQYEVTIKDLEKQLTVLQIVNPKNPQTQRYRQVYATLFTTSVGQEQYIDVPPVDRTKDQYTGIKYNRFINYDGTFNSKDYDITVKSVGRGPLSFITDALSNPDSIPDSMKNQEKYITCVWSPTLKEVLVSRTEPRPAGQPPLPVTTPSGSAEYCAFTVTLKSDPRVKSTGYVQARIINIAPVAKNDSFTLKYGNTAPIQLNILANDNDDGDGTSNVPGYPTGRNVFYEDKETNSYANIKVSDVKQTDTGFETDLGYVNFQYVQPCPNSSTTSEEETCYGGKITYTAKNIFSPFNDSFKYKVLDADRMESNEATVRIVNTATTTDDTRGNSGNSTGSGGGGGGSVGWLALAGLGLLAAARRRLIRN